MTIAIEAMQARDVPPVLDLWRRTPGVGLNEGDDPAGLAVFLARNPGLSLVARHGERIVAAVLCGHDGRRGYLYHLAVAEEYRGRGLGTSLVERGLAGLAAAGIPKCTIVLYADNESGERFWRRRGWSVRTDLKVLQHAVPQAPAQNAAEPAG